MGVQYGGSRCLPAGPEGPGIERLLVEPTRNRRLRLRVCTMVCYCTSVRGPAGGVKTQIYTVKSLKTDGETVGWAGFLSLCQGPNTQVSSQLQRQPINTHSQGRRAFVSSPG